MLSASRILLIAALLALLAAAYSNHFNNSFHFDDFHTIQDNVHIRSLKNIPRFFTDARTFSNLPTHQVYRPLLTTTLAVDYAAGKGRTIAFHITTFCFFLLYIGLLFWLFFSLLNASYPHALNWAAALLTVAIYALHPVCAETINYIIQRADLLSTLGLTAGLAIYAARPAWRRSGVYLAPVALGILCKPPALVFPILLFSYIFLFESRSTVKAARAAVPALAVCAALAILLSSMTAATFNPGGTPADLYRITQMYVSLHYFWTFFAPVHLSADTDWRVLPGMHDEKAIAGLLFLLGVVGVIWFAQRRRATAPVAFGLIWFLVALFPTSWMPLAEVANDHRMFFPFAGLSLAVVWSLRLALSKWLEFRWLRLTAAAVACMVLAAEARGTHGRNEVWRNEETLWRDVTIKSPTNGRGLMNYALVRMAKGDIETALRYLEQARAYTPDYFFLEINLGIAKGEVGQNTEAEKHFLRALQLEPRRYEPNFYYARWLHKRGRVSEAAARLEAAVEFNAFALDARHLLMQLYFQQANWERLGPLSVDTLRIVPSDPTSLRYKTASANRPAVVGEASTAQGYLQLSLAHYQAGRFADCIKAAEEALRLKPDYPEAYNNVAAGYNSLRRWPEAIRAADHALRLKPDFELARNNRAWALSQQQLAAKGR